MKSEPRAFASLSSGLLARKGAARPAMRPQGFGQGGGNLDDLGWNDMGHDLPRPALAPVSDDGAVPAIARAPLAGLSPISPVHDQQAEIEERFNAYSSDADEDAEGEEEDEVVNDAAYGSLTGAADREPEIDEDEEEDTLDLVAEAPVPEVVAAPAPVPAPAPAPVPAFVPAPVMQVMPKAAPVRVNGPLAGDQRPRSEPAAKGKAAFTLRLDPARHLKLRLACAVTGTSAQQLVTRALDELLAAMPELDAMAQQAPLDRTSK